MSSLWAYTEMIEDIKFAFSRMFKLAFYSHPCKKCIVKACCSEQCERKIEINVLLLEGFGFTWSKIYSIAVILMILTQVLTWTTMIVKQFI